MKKTWAKMLLGAAVVVCAGWGSSAQALTWNLADGGRVPVSGTVGSADFYFDVTGEGSILDLVMVRLAIQHTFDGDLTVKLFSPGGTEVMLTDGNGGSGENYQDTLFSDTAATAITDGTAPFAGTYRPEGSLAAFVGENPNTNGTNMWRLSVTDNESGDFGYLYGANNVAPGDVQLSPWAEMIGTQLILRSHNPVGTDNGGGNVVPEPVTGLMGLAGLGALGLRVLGRRRG